MKDDEEEDDRPRRPRKRKRDRDDEDEEDEWNEEDDDRPRRRRRPRPTSALDEPGMALVLPVNTSVLAIIAGYLGLFSVLCIPAPLALILGILALISLNKNPKLHGRYRAIFAVVMGGIFTAILLVVIALAIVQKK